MFLVKNRICHALLSLLFLLSYTVSANSDSRQTIDNILATKEAPAGVVFEVVSGDESYLQTALEDFETYQEALRTQFPDIELAIVSHGSEQFSLTTANQSAYQETHALVQRIVDNNVPVSVCGGHAKWRDMAAEDFPDYVEVPASGPAAIKDYQALGYVLVIL